MHDAVRPPADFLSYMAELLGEDYSAFAASYKAPAIDGLRVNDLKVKPQDLLDSLPADLSPLPWCPVGFTTRSDASLGRHPYHAAGLYYLQEPSAMAVAQVLAPQPGERVLDLCAAPGGKATHIASLMRDQGLLVANDVHSRRARILSGNLERWGLTNTAILSETPQRCARRFPAFFDRVLVDAPCSGEGMFRRSESARAQWSRENVRGCARRQREILVSAARMVRPGGWLCYATCTFSPEENEEVVASFLCDHTEFEIVDPPRCPGLDRGHPEWVKTSQPLERAVRLWPHRASGEGHFVALMQRRSGETVRPQHACPAGAALSSVELLAEFCRQHLTMSIQGRLVTMGPRIYRSPPDLPNLGGLQVVRPGWLMGVVHPGRLDPSHALAMALCQDEARLTLDLSADGPEVYAYLQGSPLRSSGEDGWLLVTVDGHALGWGKRVRGIVKNHYPRKLRWPPR